MVDGIFSDDALAAIPANILDAFADAAAAAAASDPQAGATAAEELFLEMLQIPSVVAVLEAFGVDVDLLQATATIAEVVSLSKEDGLLKPLIPLNVDVQSMQKAVVTLSADARAAFAHSMPKQLLATNRRRMRRRGGRRSRNVDDDAAAAVAAAWTAMVVDETLAKEMNAAGIDVPRIAIAAASINDSCTDICGDRAAGHQRRGFRKVEIP